MDVKLTQASLAYGQALARVAEAGGLAGEGGGAGTRPNFAELVSEAVGESIGATRQSEGMALQSLNKSVELTDIVAAVTNAEVTLETVVAVRDRVIAAYQDIIKMPI